MSVEARGRGEPSRDAAIDERIQVLLATAPPLSAEGSLLVARHFAIGYRRFEGGLLKSPPHGATMSDRKAQMDKATALGRATAHLVGSGLVADPEDVHRNELQQLWLIGTFDSQQRGDVIGATAVCVRDDGMVYDVNRAPFESEWQGIHFPGDES